MNNARITDFIDELFVKFEHTNALHEQKEELKTNMTERVKDYMAMGYDFDRAFDTAKNDLGDVNELVADLNLKKHDTFHDHDTSPSKTKIDWRMLIALTPFIFLGLGFAFDWWAWAWVIIPVSAIWLGANISWTHKIVATTPFIFVMGGMFFGWWAWGWVIIPVSAILFGAIQKR
ncbi:MAG: permease prefix domain 1-containing protein [Defluviitaleaceae bacterium]|nr:permease prefix domain 1-containing protein [Defluviitaleaceae bacterium]